MTDRADTARPFDNNAVAPRPIHMPTTAPTHAGATVPTGLQTTAELSRRRWIMLGLNLGTWALMMWVAARILGAGGWVTRERARNA